jgi:diguanylate cyclase (GGDEF)-like protein
LAQIKSRRDVLLAVLAITAASVVLSVGLAAWATTGQDATDRRDIMVIAAKISALVSSIMSYGVVDAIRAIVKMKDSVERLARTDDLTGLDNRRAFLTDAAGEILRAERHGEALALLIVDLDYFKRVNDAHGHRVGDLVLVAVAEVISRSVREGVDIVGRLGGEEFAVLLARCDEDRALRAAESIRALIEAMRVPTPAGEIVMTASVGCAPIVAGDCISAALQKADEALYAAKRGGRNQVAACAKANGGSDPRERTDRQRREPAARPPLKRSA